MLSQNIWCSFLYSYFCSTPCAQGFKEEGQDSSLLHSVWYNGFLSPSTENSIVPGNFTQFYGASRFFCHIGALPRYPQRIRTTGCFTPGGCTWVWKNVLKHWITIFNFSVSPPKNRYWLNAESICDNNFLMGKDFLCKTTAHSCFLQPPSKFLKIMFYYTMEIVKSS